MSQDSSKNPPGKPAGDPPGPAPEAAGPAPEPEPTVASSPATDPAAGADGGEALADPGTHASAEQPLVTAGGPPAPPGAPGEAPVPPPGPPPPVPGEKPKRKRRTGLIVIGVVAGVLLILCLGGIALVVLAGGDGEVPAAGDCLTASVDPNEMDVVDCGSAEAAWTVIGTDGTMTRGEFSGLTQDAQVCQAYPETEQALWVTSTRFGVDDSTSGEVVCLQRTA